MQKSVVQFANMTNQLAVHEKVKRDARPTGFESLLYEQVWHHSSAEMLEEATHCYRTKFGTIPPRRCWRKHRTGEENANRRWLPTNLRSTPRCNDDHVLQRRVQDYRKRVRNVRFSPRASETKSGIAFWIWEEANRMGSQH